MVQHNHIYFIAACYSEMCIATYVNIIPNTRQLERNFLCKVSSETYRDWWNICHFLHFFMTFSCKDIKGSKKNFGPHAKRDAFITRRSKAEYQSHPIKFVQHSLIFLELTGHGRFLGFGHHL